MKALLSAMILAATVGAPAASFAQSNQQPATRAEVRAELVRLEKGGCNPASDRQNYPSNIQVAEACGRSQREHAVAQAELGGYGGAQTDGTSQASSRSTVDEKRAPFAN
ncbi:DUF4148 domain-containing protein [Paraburkholderia sp. JHI869]|uniref:DUF4148 domain-containing protein n=1 Tax=Paraburkholderia sp. JHI869 TaxID=3112959 RepID=UPI00317871EB